MSHSPAAPVTTYPCLEEYPSFSPDCRQIAFYWDGEKGATPGIYFKQLGETNTIRLTSGQDAYPAWSPNGKGIAFVRGVEPGVLYPGHGIYTVSALGGGGEPSEPRRISDPKSPAFDIAPAPGGRPRQVTRQGMEMYGLTWSRDGRSHADDALSVAHGERWPRGPATRGDCRSDGLCAVRVADGGSSPI